MRKKTNVVKKLAGLTMIGVMAVSMVACSNSDSKSKNDANKNVGVQESKEARQDKENAKEIMSELGTCISDYESQDGAYELGSCTVSWKNAVASVSPSSAGQASSGGDSFETIVNDAITSITKSKETGEYATAEITSNDGEYTIKVVLGNQKVTK